MRPFRSVRRGFTLVELLVVVFIIGALAAMILPAVQSSRETARRAQCLNHLKQMGLAMHDYHDIHQSLPAGCMPDIPDPVVGQGWGWAVMLLPHLEQRPLFDRMAVLHNSLADVIASADYQPYIRERISLFICPSDEPHDKTHVYRAFTGFMLGADVVSTGTRPPQQQLGPLPLSLPLGPSTLAFCKHGSRPVSSGTVLAGPSSYVGSFGDSWTPTNTTFMTTDAEMQGDGLFGSNSFVRFSDISDGLSSTFAVGERNWNDYGAVWSGVDFWDHCDMSGLSMTMGTVYYPMNSDPNTYPQSCDQKGAAGFSSYHPGGALFLFADGSARFISQDIQSENNGNVSAKGVYQRLANRGDGLPLGDF